MCVSMREGVIACYRCFYPSISTDPATQPPLHTYIRALTHTCANNNNNNNKSIISAIKGGSNASKKGHMYSYEYLHMHM